MNRWNSDIGSSRRGDGETAQGARGRRGGGYPTDEQGGACRDGHREGPRHDPSQDSVLTHDVTHFYSERCPGPAGGALIGGESVVGEGGNGILDGCGALVGGGEGAGIGVWLQGSSVPGRSQQIREQRCELVGHRQTERD